MISKILRNDYIGLEDEHHSTNIYIRIPCQQFLMTKPRSGNTGQPKRLRRFLGTRGRKSATMRSASVSPGFPIMRR